MGNKFPAFGIECQLELLILTNCLACETAKICSRGDVQNSDVAMQDSTLSLVTVSSFLNIYKHFCLKFGGGPLDAVYASFDEANKKIDFSSESSKKVWHILADFSSSLILAAASGFAFNKQVNCFIRNAYLRSSDLAAVVVAAAACSSPASAIFAGRQTNVEQSLRAYAPRNRKPQIFQSLGT